MRKRKSNHKLDPAAQAHQLNAGLPGLTEKESALMRNLIRAVPDAVLNQIIQVVPVPLLILAIDEAPVRGNRKTIPGFMLELSSLQEKLIGSLKTENDPGPAKQ